MNKKYCYLVLVVVLFGGTQGFSQCKSFSKKCLPQLKPYFPSEQQYKTTMLNGESIDVRMTFYYGDNNRLLICADEKLGDIELKINDSSGKTFFSTKSRGTIQWDFNVESTQDLTLEITTAEKPEYQDFDQSGCLNVLVGFK